MAYASPSTPSLTTTVITTSTTFTSYLTVTTGGPNPPDIVGPIEGLAPCSQGIVFESLANSRCNPSDFLCICRELVDLDIAGIVRRSCSAADALQYDAFQNMVCGGRPFTPTSVIITPTPAPINNATIPSNRTTTAPPAVVTTHHNGTGHTTTVILPIYPPGPVNPANRNTPITTRTPAGATAAPPTYNGGAAGVKIGVFACAIGFMGLVFAEL